MSEVDSLNSDIFVIANWGHSKLLIKIIKKKKKKKKRLANIVNPDETALYKPSHQGSTLFAMVYVLVCRVERITAPLRIMQYSLSIFARK